MPMPKICDSPVAGSRHLLWDPPIRLLQVAGSPRVKTSCFVSIAPIHYSNTTGVQYKVTWVVNQLGNLG